MNILRSIINCLQSNQIFGIVNLFQKICYSSFRWFMTIIGPIFIVLAHALIFFIVYIFFMYVLPSITQNSVWKVLIINLNYSFKF